MTDTTGVVSFEHGGCRVQDIAYTAFMMAKQPNDEDGGPSDWFNDTWPTIKALIASQPDTSLHNPASDLDPFTRAEVSSASGVRVDKDPQPDTGDVAALREALEAIVRRATNSGGNWYGDVASAALSKPNAPGAVSMDAKADNMDAEYRQAVRDVNNMRDDGTIKRVPEDGGA